MPKTTINISTSTLVRFTLIVLAVLLLYFLREIVLMIFAALLLAVAFDRPIDALERRKVPRSLGVIFVYLLLFSVIALLFYLVFPVLAAQIKNLVTNYSFYLETLSRILPRTEFIDLKDVFGQLADKLTASADAVLGTLVAFFGGIISFFTVLVVAIFLNVQENGVKKFIFYLTPEEHQKYVLGLFDKIQQKVGSWVWGKVILAFIIGILTFVGMSIMGIKYAVLLGFLAGLLNFIPLIGAFIAAVPAVLLALYESPLLAVAVVLFYIFINAFLESFLLMPLLMKKAVDLNPALIILVLVIGGKVAGTLGVILAIPAAAIIAVLVDDYMQRKNQKDGFEAV